MSALLPCSSRLSLPPLLLSFLSSLPILLPSLLLLSSFSPLLSCPGTGTPLLGPLLLSRLRWVCAGLALRAACVPGLVLGLCCACAGLPLSLHRVCSCSGLALLAVGLRWASAGLALGLRWACAGLALGFHLRRGCTPALLVLRLHWTATLRTCFRPPRGPPRADGWRSKTYRAFALR